jgi:hypothetical protein
MEPNGTHKVHKALICIEHCIQSGDTSNRVRVFATVDITQWALGTERPAEKDRRMLEQEAEIQAKTAAEPQKSGNAGLYVDGDTSNRVLVIAAVDSTLGDTRYRYAGRKGQREG